MCVVRCAVHVCGEVCCTCVWWGVLYMCVVGCAVHVCGGVYCTCVW